MLTGESERRPFHLITETRAVVTCAGRIAASASREQARKFKEP
jgi:hypothetical protein